MTTCHGDRAAVKTSTRCPEHQLGHLVDTRILAVLALIGNGDNSLAGCNLFLFLPGLSHQQFVNASIFPKMKGVLASSILIKKGRPTSYKQTLPAPGVVLAEAGLIFFHAGGQCSTL